MLDPYLYPGTNTLINKFGVKDSEKLQDLEAALFRLQIAEPVPQGNLDYNHLKSIHRHFFGELYEWAGNERSVDITKGESHFARKEFITPELNKLFLKLKSDDYLQELDHTGFCKKLSFYFNEINAAHPFREGNGRALRAFCDVLSEKAGYYLDWTKVQAQEYIQASIKGFNGDYEAMETVFKKVSFSQSLDQQIENTSSIFNSTSIEKFKVYAEKQAYLSELINQKNKFLIQDPAQAKSFGQEAMKLSKELKDMAKELIADSEVQKLLKHPQTISLQKQGGFSAVYERLKNNQVDIRDLIILAKHASSNIQTLSISQAREQGKGRSY